MLTVHHLNNSRSQRVLWLLEELGVPYEIVKYERDAKTSLAPAALRAIHPLGKSPVVTDNGITLAESSAILEYILEKYGGGRLQPAKGTPDYERYRYFMHYAEGSLMPFLLMRLITGRIRKAPLFVRPVANKIANTLDGGFVVPNLTRYPGWLVETETPFVALAAFAPAVLRGRPRRVAVAAAGIVTLTVAIHLAYTVFDEWWYLRFLLPALPLLLVFSVMVLRRIVPRVAVAAACAAIAAWGIHVAVRRQVFELQGLESRFRLTGEYAARALPANAVVFAVQQSGSARFHGGRASLSWDVIAPDALDGTIAWARARGFAPVIALEDEEAPRFRARFGTQAAGQLDWPPDAEIHAPVRVRIFDPGRRVEYTNGGRVQTEHIRR